MSHFLFPNKTNDFSDPSLMLQISYIIMIFLATFTIASFCIFPAEGMRASETGLTKVEVKGIYVNDGLQITKEVTQSV